MPDFVVKDDLLAPAEKKTLQYSGVHPSRLLKEVPEILKSVLKISGSKVFEEQIKWDVSGDPVGFYGVWKANLPKDAISKIWVKIIIQGSQTKKEKNGSMSVYIFGHLESKFNYSTELHKSLLWLYNFLFYNNQRRKHIEEGKIHVERVEDEIRSLLNLMGRKG